MSSKGRESMKEVLARFILDHQAAVCTDRCIFESIQLPYSLIKASESVMKNCVISLHGKQPAQFVSDTQKIFELQIIWVSGGASFMQVCSKGKAKEAGPIFPAHLQVLPLEFLPETQSTCGTALT